MQKALLIAEKPSLRRTIEDVYKKHQSEIPYEITFMEQRGHLLTLKSPDELDEALKEWSWETLPIHPEEHGGWQYKKISEKKSGNFLTAGERYDNIKKELNSNQYDFIINAGDPDQEGELLVRIVLAGIKTKLPIKRYWSNDTTEYKVLDALKNLRDDQNDPMLINLLKAAYGRQHSDWRFGMNISRAATLKLNVRVSCGRVKTPIMAMVCKREADIVNFVPKTIYGIKAIYSEGFDGQLLENKTVTDAEEDTKEDSQKYKWFDSKEDAVAFFNDLGETAIVTSSVTKRNTTYAPKLFKLATAQMAASKEYGYTSSDTLEYIQSLYEKGYLTYPRTDCEYLSSNENLRLMIQSASSIPELLPYIKEISSETISKVHGTKKWINDKELEKAGHSALVPTDKKPDFVSLTVEEQNIYRMICRQFVAIFLPPLIQDMTTIVTKVGESSFESNGKTLVDPGYTVIFGQNFNDVALPACVEGQNLYIDEYTTKDKTSTCPERFTDAELINACENPAKYLIDKSYSKLGKELKIGTPATRASIIEELIQRDKYLERKNQKKKTYIVPSQTGMLIYNAIKDCKICRVDMTGEWETLLDKIRNGELGLGDFEQLMKTDVETMIQDIRRMDIEPLAIGNKKTAIGKCPVCGGDILTGTKSYYCSNYKEKGCKIGTYKFMCETLLPAKTFMKMLDGEVVETNVKKGSNTWSQKMRYDFDECKVVWIKENKATHELKPTEYICPKCGKAMMESGNVYKCSDEPCGFKFWKISYKKPLSAEEIDSFFKTGETGFVKGLVSKNGKQFEANIVLKEDKTGTELRFRER